jgi:hypothetical protein
MCCALSAAEVRAGHELLCKWTTSTCPPNLLLAFPVAATSFGPAHITLLVFETQGLLGGGRGSAGDCLDSHAQLYLQLLNLFAFEPGLRQAQEKNYASHHHLFRVAVPLEESPDVQGLLPTRLFVDVRWGQSANSKSSSYQHASL